MVKKHVIIDYNSAKTLVLFLDFNYEFGTNKRCIKKSIIDYINSNKIKFYGKLLIVVEGVIIATFSYKNSNLFFNKFNDIKISDYKYTEKFTRINNIPEVVKKKEKRKIEKEIHESLNQSDTQALKKNTSSKKKTVKEQKTIYTSSEKKNKNISTKEERTIKVEVYKSNGEIIKLDLEEYIIGVVAAEMPASFNPEALKAQAIVARTYALKTIKQNKKLTDSVSTQSYIDTLSMKSKWGSDYSKYYMKIKNAVMNTKNMYIMRNGELIDAVYHSISNGYTENSQEVWGYSVPYLKAVESPWDKNSSGYLKKVIKSENEVFEIFNINNLNDIEILKRNSTGHVSIVKVGEDIYSGIDIRQLLSLRSTDFDFEIKENKLEIITRGYGHGVGMSQYGANGMANNGYKYDEIIKHYYQGVNIISL